MVTEGGVEWARMGVSEGADQYNCEIIYKFQCVKG